MIIQGHVCLLYKRGKGALFSGDPGNRYETPDLRPKLSGKSVIDAADLVPNVNFPYMGYGPDIGAYEHGQAITKYGPRH